MSPLQMAIHLKLTPVVEALCNRGADVNNSDGDGNTALWVALKSHQLDIALSLVHCFIFCFAKKIFLKFLVLRNFITFSCLNFFQVKHGADTNFWSPGVNNCIWTLLHRAIFERDEETACFLIQNKCDIHR